MFTINRPVMKGAQPGFSLTEIIIAIAIIGIMVAGTLGLVSWIGRARVTSTKTTLGLYKNMLEQYRQDKSTYPATLDEIRNSEYLDESTPTQDSWGNEIQYVVHNPKGGKNAYELYSFGPDGEGAPDDKWIRAK